MSENVVPAVYRSNDDCDRGVAVIRGRPHPALDCAAIALIDAGTRHGAFWRRLERVGSVSLRVGNTHPSRLSTVDSDGDRRSIFCHVRVPAANGVGRMAAEDAAAKLCRRCLRPALSGCASSREWRLDRCGFHR